MDFEQLFDSFPLAPFAPSGALVGSGETQDLSHADRIGGGEDEVGGRKEGSTMTMVGGTGVMTLENANEIAAVAFELAGMDGGSDGGCVGSMEGMKTNDVDDDDVDANKMYEAQVLGGEGKMEGESFISGG